MYIAATALPRRQFRVKKGEEFRDMYFAQVVQDLKPPVNDRLDITELEIGDWTQIGDYVVERIA